MSKQEVPLQDLEKYIPRGAYEQVTRYLNRYKVHLTITPERSSVLGNYQGAFKGKNHRITVNGNLNKYSFLITLLHELGHLVTYDKYGVRIQAHGVEWKYEYGRLLTVFISQKIFPKIIEAELISTLEDPSASSCTEISLLRVLRKFDPPKPGYFLLEELPEKSFFKTSNGALFRKILQKRTRILCSMVGTSRQYLFSPVTEVQLVRKR